MTTKSKIFNTLGVKLAEDFVYNVTETSSLYVFAAKHTPYSVDGSDQNIPDPVDTPETSLSIYNDMIFGKRIRSSDIARVIPRYDWVANTTYSMYVDTDATLSESTFYACVNVGTQTRVYKCLYNNKTGPSTVEPYGTDPDPFQTPEDGYMWKYMYTANDTMTDKFSTLTHIPVVPNTDVTTAAKPGSIEVITVDQAGVGYNNYFVDEFRRVEDINIGGSGYLYGLGAEAPSTDNFYSGCVIKMTSGAAKDEYRYITGYYISNNQKIIVLDDPFDTAPSVTDTFEIYPCVYVFDTGGTKQTNCVARAIINAASSNSVTRVDILESGTGYRAANTFVGFRYDGFIKKDVVSTEGLIENSVARSATYTDAVLTPIISPPGGHGSDVYEELGARHVSISTKFIENEYPITTSNDYRIVGLIQDPLFANVRIQTDIGNTVGSFAAGELIYSYTSARVGGSVTSNSTSQALTGSSTTFLNDVQAGDSVIVSTGAANFVGDVLSVANNTYLTLTANAPFTAAGMTIDVIREKLPYGYMVANTTGEITLANVSVVGVSTATARLLGSQSFCTSHYSNTAIPVTIEPYGRPANTFNSFNQLASVVGTKISVADFTADEVITQDSLITYAQPSAVVHSSNTTAIMMTNITNIFETYLSAISDGVITGNSSGAQFTVTAKYSGELVPDSGDIVYVDYLTPISRANNQTEAVKFVLSF